MLKSQVMYMPNCIGAGGVEEAESSQEVGRRNVLGVAFVYCFFFFLLSPQNNPDCNFNDWSQTPLVQGIQKPVQDAFCRPFD